MHLLWSGGRVAGVAQGARREKGGCSDHLRPGLAAYPLPGRLMFAAVCWQRQPCAVHGSAAPVAAAADYVARCGPESSFRPRKLTSRPLAHSTAESASETDFL